MPSKGASQQRQTYMSTSFPTQPQSNARNLLAPFNAHMTAATSSSSVSPAPVATSPQAALTPAQIPGHTSFLMQASNTFTLNTSNALELMRTYHLYVRVLKTRWRSIVVFLFALLFFSCCTFRGPQEQGLSELDSLHGSGSGSSGAGNMGGIGAGGPGVAGGLAGPAAAAGPATLDGEGAVEDYMKTTDSHRRYFQPPWLLRVLLGCATTVGRMEMSEVRWWDMSNRTTENADPNSERGLNVGTPNAASLSVARSEPPWSADTRRGLIAVFSRAFGYLSRLTHAPDPPSYEQALSAFFRTRQAMSEGSCNRCQAQMIEQEVRTERLQYRRFLRENKLRVPLLLYYNRLPVYAMLQHFRLMRVRNYQLLDYVSRPDSVLRRPETVAYDVSNDAALHARELDFELTRLSFVFYLQRLHLRALRHADAMRLETFHFLRFLSSTVPTLRQIWTGQDPCHWPGVSCVVVRVPMHLLVDDDHPAVQAFVEDVFSVCRGPGCTQRRCIPPGCAAFTQKLTRRLFTSAAPGYWMRWDRRDDTAAMDEMIFAKKTSPKTVGGEAAAAAAAQQQQQQQEQNSLFGAARRSFPTGSQPQPQQSTHDGRAEGDGGVSHGGPNAYVAARASRATTSSSRTVWTEQQFAYEHPDLLLADPLLLVDVDIQSIVEEIVSPATPTAQAAGASVKPADTYRENVERPLVEDLLPMQDRLIRTMAAAAPRGLQFGRQDSHTPVLTIPFTFVALNLANMGLRGYLPDFYDTQSTYDVSEAAAAAASLRSGGINGGMAPMSTAKDAEGGSGGDEDERTSLLSTGGSAAAAAAAAAGGGCDACGAAGRAREVHIHDPRSDVYWGRLSRQRMLESRNLSSAPQRRSIAAVQAIASEVQRVLRRVEKIGMRNHHEDLAAYFSEVSTLAQFQNERWSPYRWPEAMITVTNAVAQSAARRLYPIVEDNAFSPIFGTAPVYNVDHHVEVFGEINPRLIALLSLDVSGNPLLSHLFPRTWLSIPFLQAVRTQGSSILAPPLRMWARTYNQTYYCPPGSGADEDSPYAEDARRSRHHVLADAARDQTMLSSVTATTATSSSDGGKTTGTHQTSMHDRDFVGAVLLPPFKKIDRVFPAKGVDAVFKQSDQLSTQQHLYRSLHAVFDKGLVQGVRQLLTQQ